MAYFLRTPDSYPLEEQVKILGTEELLDFWEESQFLEKYAEDEIYKGPSFQNNYEEVILKELQIRTCMKMLHP